MKLWALSKDRRKIFIGSNVHSVASVDLESKGKLISWSCIHLPTQFDRIDAALSYESYDDLVKLDF